MTMMTTTLQPAHWLILLNVISYLIHLQLSPSCLSSPFSMHGLAQDLTRSHQAGCDMLTTKCANLFSEYLSSPSSLFLNQKKQPSFPQRSAYHVWSRSHPFQLSESSHSVLWLSLLSPAYFQSPLRHVVVSSSIEKIKTNPKLQENKIQPQHVILPFQSQVSPQG